MGLGALTNDDAGNSAIPQSQDDWDDWVSASSTRNHVLDATLIDWLDCHGEAKGYARDGEESLDERTNFRTFIFRKGNDFEAAVLDHLRTLADVHTVEGSGGGYEARRDLAVAEATFAAMERGEEIIYQGTLRDAETRTHGSPDFLVRSDVLRELFPSSLTADETQVPAPDLGGGDWHYRVVDSKFATLHLAAGGEAGNAGSSAAFKVQLYIYNRALGRLQGYLPPTSFLLGRGWEQTSKGETTRVLDAMDRLALVTHASASRARGRLEDEANAAIEWLRRMRHEGGAWQAAPEPSVDELRVDAAGDHAPWSNAVEEILAQTEDLTTLWQVGVGKRQAANTRDFTRWTDPSLAPADVGVNGPTTRPKLQAMLDVNRDLDGPPVRPARVMAAREQWYEPPPVDFYVDFETVNSLDDDFSTFPKRGGQELIFMIGCGHVEHGKWVFECFTTDALTESHEAEIIDQWFDHMGAVRDRLAPGADPRVIHWSPAEEFWLETADYAAVKRHLEMDWPHPNWFDFLTRVVREEPVVVRGAHDFGLKPVTKAMHALGLIDVEWGDGPTDGLGAMVGAWWCAHEAERQGVSLIEQQLMQEIRDYNEIDCKAMMEIVQFLRMKH